MQIIIHRGTHEIGGTCIELISEGKSLLLDLGLPLLSPNHALSNDAEADAFSAPIQSLLQRAATNPEAISGIVLSHAHLDHYGLLTAAHPAIPIHASLGTKLLLEINNIFLQQSVNLANLHILPIGETTKIGPFAITSYLVDHSAPDALAFLIEAEGKRVFYSGDLRSHGRKGILFQKMLREPPTNIDLLLLEGTLMGRGRQEYASESAVETALAEVFLRKENLALIFSSGQNIDRLVSVFRAVKQTDSTLIIDLYTAFVLRKLRAISDKLPQFEWPEIRIFIWKHHADSLAKSGHTDFVYAANKKRIRVEEMAICRKRIVMLARANQLFSRVLRYLPDMLGLEIIWSMWPGYLTDDNPVKRFCSKQNLVIQQIHTSGHATVAELKRLALAINPKRLIPIHTFEPNEFVNIFENVMVANDGEVMTI